MEEVYFLIDEIIGTGAPLFVLERNLKGLYKDLNLEFRDFPKSASYAEFRNNVLSLFDEYGNLVEIRVIDCNTNISAVKKVYQLCEFCGEYDDDYRPMNHKLYSSKEAAFRSSVIYQDCRVTPFIKGDYILGVYKTPEIDTESESEFAEYVVMCDALYKQKVIELELY